MEAQESQSEITEEQPANVDQGLAGFERVEGIGDERAVEKMRLGPEQIRLLREAEDDFESGKGYSFDEVMQHARAKVRTWLPSQTA